MKNDNKQFHCDFCEMSETKNESGINWKKTLTIISGAVLLLAFAGRYFALPKSAVESLYLISIFSGGYFVFLGAIRGLFKKRFLNIDFLVVVAAAGAVYINQLAEAAAVIFFFSLAEMLEEFGIERSRKALEALIKKSPQTATLLDGRKVPVDEVKIKEIIIVRPGDLIPLDGIVIKGNSSVDEATITGESVPKDKREKDIVFAGTMNLNGYLEIEVTKESKNSTFSKIIELVDKAQRSRAQKSFSIKETIFAGFAGRRPRRSRSATLRGGQSASRWAGSAPAVPRTELCSGAGVRVQNVAQSKFERRSVIATIRYFQSFLARRKARFARQNPYISGLNQRAGGNQKSSLFLLNSYTSIEENI